MKTLLETRREVQLFAVCLWRLGEHLRNRPPWYSVPTGAQSFSDAIEWVTLTPGVVIRPPGVLTPDMALGQLASLAQAARALIEAVNQLPPKVRAELQSLTGHAEYAVSFAREWAPKLENVDSWPNVENLYCTDVLRFLQTIGDPRKLAEDYRSFRKKVSRHCALYGEDTWFDPPPPTKPSDCPPNEFVFRRDGDGWFISGFGEKGHFSDIVGFQYIHKLLQSPGKEILTVSLLSNGQETPMLGGDAVLDDKTKKDIQKRLDEIEAEIETARKNNDFAKVERLEEKRQELIDYIQSGVGINGRDRKLGDQADKVRVRVNNAVNRAYKKLAPTESRKTTKTNKLKKLVAHLQASITIGAKSSSYHPHGTPPDWRLE